MGPRGTVGFEIRELSLLIGRYLESHRLDEEMEMLRGPQAWALGYLYEHQYHTIYQKDLEKEMSIRKSTASNLVKRMVKNGVITTAASEKDGRLKALRITDKGILFMEKINSFMETSEAKITNGLSSEEMAQFFQTIQKIKKNLS
ncbi:MarR family winged helix-turn-helix transcriptional regulator [Pisciglobus halotolerans]|uniref:DNA-binding transcriptional regulator, MarR family n=1 Tax=Pisciglobus halotolerans TaxID=745365 RepID=A0A1I3E3D2_9LACT|nr:MarR family winged helix-turn-helix transcriptional regulator [Pisciglobus halotolerans]SFH93475.1 DNA-binding transcriptional regulator, MarR family [Pisciglobus halotolerans]